MQRAKTNNSGKNLREPNGKKQYNLRLVRFLILIPGVFIGPNVVWASVIGKSLASSLVIGLMLIRKKTTALAFAISSALILIYFSAHEYSGPHDLKAFLLYVHFLAPVLAISVSGKIPPPKPILFYALCFSSIAVSLALGGQFTVNTHASEMGRFRGVFPFFLIALLITLSRIPIAKQFALILTFSLFGFILTGGRGAALTFTATSIGALAPRGLRLVSVAAANTSVLALTWFVGFAQLSNDTTTNIGIRALSIKEIAADVSWLGAGMTPDLRTFHREGQFDHFFVPADVACVGALYELGLVFLVAKTLFYTYLLRKFPRSRGHRFTLMAFGYFYFGYFLTFDAISAGFTLLLVASYARPTNLAGLQS